MPRGQPQVEVTLDIDVNGILNVSAVEKSTGKVNKITITNDKGRLSPQEIERLVKEAEKFKDEDEKVRGKIEAKNQLEQYCYSMRTTMGEEKLKDKFSEDEKKDLNEHIDKALKWMNETPSAEKEEYEARVKELEAKFNPIMMRVYQEAGMGGGPGGPGGMPNFQGGNFPGGPTGGEQKPSTSQSKVDEVD